ncbi:MAG: radical SAM protein [Candidatus Pacearchaeota archaeon]|nr:radical SAM protein [Candidatus Pacearchaeota archaeon]
MDLKKWVEHCYSLYNKINCIDTKTGEKKYLLANFKGTSQQKDIEQRTALIGDYFRIKINSKAFDDDEMRRQGKELMNFKDNEKVFGALRNEFDMSYWAFHALHNAKLQDYNRVFISQIKGCNIFCPWCYVDDANKNCLENNGAAYFSMKEILNAFREERKKQTLNCIRTSGGEPTLAPFQWMDMLTLLDIKGLSKEVFFQGETNLTTGHFLDFLEENNDVSEYFFEKIGNYRNFGVLCSFKGTDTESFLKASGLTNKDGTPNKEYAFLDDERWYSFDKLVRAGIDAYPFIYDPNPETLESFMEKGAKKFGDEFYLKTWIFPLKLYGPEKERMEAKGLDPKIEQKRLDDNFAKSKEIMQEIIYKKFGVNYQAIPRTGMELQLEE